MKFLNKIESPEIDDIRRRIKELEDTLDLDGLITLTNLIENGDFSTPILESGRLIGGVRSFRSYSMAEYQGFLSMDGYYRDGQDYSWFEFPATPGHVYYITSKVYGKTEMQLVEEGVKGTSIADRNVETWGRMSAKITVGELETSVKVSTTSTYLTKLAGFFRDYIVIDLTEAFQEGTPSVSVLDAYVESLPGEWFSTWEMKFSDLAEEESVLEDKDAIPEWAALGIKQISQIVKSRQRANTLTFGHITDGHYRFEYRHPDRPLSINHYQAISVASQTTPMSFMVHGGDIIDGRLPRAQSLDDLEESVKRFVKESACPVIFLKGNHDDNTGYAQRDANASFAEVITDVDYYNSTNRFSQKYIKTDKENRTGSYFYTDDDISQIRTIALNTTDIEYAANADGKMKVYGLISHSVRQAQLNWLIKTLEELPEGWDVIILAHVPLESNLRRLGDSDIKNEDLLKGILNSFSTKTAYTGSSIITGYEAEVSSDFTSRSNGEIICQIYGHHHRDNVSVVDGITHITCLNSLAERTGYEPKEGVRNDPSRKENSITEDAWRVITIDKDLRKIFYDSYGAGESYEIDY